MSFQRLLETAGLHGRLECGYESLEIANRVMWEYHSLSLILAITVAPMLLCNHNLHRFYTPLAKIVNVVLILEVLCDISYFAFYPYTENKGNCTEYLTDRIFTAGVMFGELHQIYLLANILGMGNYRFNVGSCYSFSIDTMLKTVTILVVISMMYATFMHRSFIITKNLWSIFVCSLQIYFIKVSNAKKERVTSILPTTASSVRIFDKLAKLELLPSVICYIERMLDILGIHLLPPYFDSVTLVLDVMTDLLFYLKVILIKENADISLEVVEV